MVKTPYKNITMHLISRTTRYTLLLIIINNSFLHARELVHEQPFIRVTYRSATLVNSITNAVEWKTNGEFYIEFYTYRFYYVEGGIVDEYKIIDSRTYPDNVTMILRNKNNHRCSAKFEEDKLTIMNRHTKKAVVLTNPYYHDDSENETYKPSTSNSNSIEPIQLEKVYFSGKSCSYYIPISGNTLLTKSIEKNRVFMMKNIFEHFISDDPKGWALTKEHIEEKYDSNRAQTGSLGSQYLLNVNRYYQNSQVISISYNYSIFRGGANADYGFIVDSFDKLTGKIIEIEDVIVNRRKFLTIAERQFRKENGIPESTSLNDYNCLYFKDNQFKLSNQFEFTQEGIHFIYNLYEVGCRTAGILEFTLPYSDLDGIANYIN